MPDDRTNPDLLGEFNVFYYQIGDYDIESKVAPYNDILDDDTWNELCITDLDIPFNFAEHTYNDRCAAEMEEVAPGRMNFSMTFNLHQLRVPTVDRQNWDDAIWTRKIIAILALTEGRDVVGTFGFCGNFVMIQAQQTQPQEGPNTETYTARPAARSAYDPAVVRVYRTLAPTALILNNPTE